MLPFWYNSGVAVFDHNGSGDVRRVLAWIVPFCLLVLPGTAICLWPDQIDTFMPRHDVPFTPFLPYLVLLVTAVLASQFNQTRITFLCVALALVNLRLSLGPERPPDELTLISVSLCAVYAIFFWIRERGLVSKGGLLRIVILATLCAVPLAWRFRTMRSYLPAQSSKAAIVSVVCLSIALLAMLAGRSAVRRVLRPGFVASLVAAHLALTGDGTFWPEDSGHAVVSLYMLSAAVLLLFALYSLSWRHAYTDALTGQTNRRALDEALGRLGKQFAIAMVDIDNFKKLNDRHGHQVGDDVLAFMAAQLHKNRVGKVYRYGGEEFAILCPRKTAADVGPAIDKLRKSIAKSRFVLRAKVRDPKLRNKQPKKGKSKRNLKVTVSIGVASSDNKNGSPATVLKAADKALYKAKRDGRNRTVVV
jgi:diguanylate cyclase (GGDEF)-like protein